MTSICDQHCCFDPLDFLTFVLTDKMMMMCTNLMTLGIPALVRVLRVWNMCWVVLLPFFERLFCRFKVWYASSLRTVVFVSILAISPGSGVDTSLHGFMGVVDHQDQVMPGWRECAGRNPTTSALNSMHGRACLFRAALGPKALLLRCGWWAGSRRVSSKTGAFSLPQQPTCPSPQGGAEPCVAAFVVVHRERVFVESPKVSRSVGPTKHWAGLRQRFACCLQHSPDAL